LAGPESATTVRFGPDGPPVVTDGPFLEGKEGIGGYAVGWLGQAYDSAG